MKTIVLIRHAETVMAGKFCGQSDPDLSTAGQAQLTRIAQEVAPLGIQRILSSDLLRTLRTAQAIGQHVGIPVEIRPSLREIQFGLWEGLSWADIEARFPCESRAWVAEFPLRSAPEGEAYLNFAQRIDSEFCTLLRGNPDQVTAVVTHRGVMRYVLTRFFDRSKEEGLEQTAPYGAVIPIVWRQVVPEAAL